MKIFLDDIRTPPDDTWTLAKWPNKVIEYLKTGKVTEISLDHDLGDDERGNGNDVILWIEEQVCTNMYHPPVIHIHTANVSARKKMEAGVESIYRNYYFCVEPYEA